MHMKNALLICVIAGNQIHRIPFRLLSNLTNLDSRNIHIHHSAMTDCLW